MKLQISLFKKRKSSSLPDNSSIFSKLKLKRNQIELKKFHTLKKGEGFHSKFATDFRIHAMDSSISISKAIFSKKPRLAAKEYSKIITDYKRFLILSGVREDQVNLLMNKYKSVLFENILSIIKKKIPREIINKQSVLSEQKRKEIKEIENRLVKDLLNFGLIKNQTRIQIKFTELNPIEGINDSYVFDDNPIKLFKDISNVYFSAMNEERSESLNNLVKGFSRVNDSKDNTKKYSSISVNTKVDNYKQLIIHELLHNYLRREEHEYARNEVAIEFLSLLFTDKYFNEYKKRDPSINLEKNQYFMGSQLYKRYKARHGLDLSKVNQFLIDEKEFIKKHTFK